MLPVHLWLVHNVLFLGSLLLLIRRASPVLLIVDGLGLNSNRSRDDAHDVLSECGSLAGTGDRGVRRCLAGIEDASENVFGGHSLCYNSLLWVTKLRGPSQAIVSLFATSLLTLTCFRSTDNASRCGRSGRSPVHYDARAHVRHKVKPAIPRILAKLPHFPGLGKPHHKPPSAVLQCGRVAKPAGLLLFHSRDRGLKATMQMPTGYIIILSHGNW